MVGSIVGFIVTLVVDILAHRIPNKIVAFITSLGGGILGAGIKGLIDEKFTKKDPLWYREHAGK